MLPRTRHLSAEVWASIVDQYEPKYQRLTVACAAYGIKRSHAYKLAEAGLLDTFKMGKSRFVYLDSLRSLPERLAELEASKRGAA